MALQDELRALLDNSIEEPPLQVFLQQHPEILMRTFGQGAQYSVVLPKFRLAEDFIPDFVMIGRRSGSAGTSWDVDLIEIEPSAVRGLLFTKKYLARGHLRVAMSQVDDWKIWMEKYEQTIFVPKAFEQLKAIGAWDDHPEFYTPTIGTHQHMIVWYRIIIGRRNDFDDRGNEYRNLILKESRNRVEIVTWDRLLDKTRLI
ncbi:MAG: Shedu anti-phage system protein SduA domain-containing protein [Dehalococcoidia bacterium]|jgi:hypothetical protein